MTRRKKTTSHTTLLRQAFNRLDDSDTQLKRRNARKNLRKVLDGIWREAHKKYPCMNADGTVRTRKTSPVCPSCGVPFKTWKAVVRHALNHHNRYQHLPLNKVGGTRIAIMCWCCKEMKDGNVFARHLQALALRGELKSHIAIEALKNL